MHQGNDSLRIAKYLEIPLIQQLLPQSVYRHLKIFEYNSEENIVDVSIDMKHLLLLVEGRAKLYAEQSNGRLLLLDFLEYPSFIGEWEMRGNTPTSTIRTITPCVCIGIPYDILDSELSDNAAFWKTMNRINGIKTQRQVDHCIKTITFPLESRLANYILKNSYNSQFREPHTETSAYLGVSYRHLLYSIESLVKKNILAKAAGGYCIVDESALRKLIK